MNSSLRQKIQAVKISIRDANKIRIGIVVSEWYPKITEALFQGAEKILLSNGILKKNIIRKNVPGSFELPLAAHILLQKNKVDAVICLGCVIKGETDHYYYICNAASNGIMNVSLLHNKPVAFGVLTVDDIKQAQERAGGKFGNKGEESALTALKMLTL
jgi:6,7-dimethyl-8-ribityllumazine synthase